MTEMDKEALAAAKKAAEFSADMPVDLASFYASKGGVDLSTLSELTKSVGVSDDGTDKDTNTRSKRTCVRVREEISKLEEILKDENSDAKSSQPSKPRAGRGKGRGSSGRSAAAAANKSAELAGDELDSSGVAAPSAKKYKRPAYSQFTHKRRKRKKKVPDEGMCGVCAWERWKVDWGGGGGGGGGMEMVLI